MDEVDTDELLRRAGAGVGDKDAATELVWRVSHASWLLESRDRDALAYRIIAGPASLDTLRATRDRVRRELRTLFRLHGEYKAAGFRI